MKLGNKHPIIVNYMPQTSLKGAVLDGIRTSPDVTIIGRGGLPGIVGIGHDSDLKNALRSY